MTVGFSFLVVGVAVALFGLGALMDHNARKMARERRHPRVPR